LSTVSFVVTYRSDGSHERQANMEAILRWTSTLPSVEIVVIEQGASPGPQIAGADKVRWLFRYNPGPFNKSWGLNVGAKVSESPILAFGDGDVICDATWHEAVRLVREELAIAKPYRHIIDLSPEESVQVRNGHWNFAPQRAPNAPRSREAQGEYVVFAGGLFLLRREVFVRVGGFDERFVGWGGEDNAMSLRLAAAGVSMAGLDLGPALHLWHPRTTETTVAQPHYRANCHLLDDYSQYSRASMERLWEVQRQLMGDADKYRPADQR